jgi:hypothetical protein
MWNLWNFCEFRQCINCLLNLIKYNNYKQSSLMLAQYKPNLPQATFIRTDDESCIDRAYSITYLFLFPLWNRNKCNAKYLINDIFKENNLNTVFKHFIPEGLSKMYLNPYGPIFKEQCLKILAWFYHYGNFNRITLHMKRMLNLYTVKFLERYHQLEWVCVCVCVWSQFAFTNTKTAIIHFRLGVVVLYLF